MARGEREGIKLSGPGITEEYMGQGTRGALGYISRLTKEHTRPIFLGLFIFLNFGTEECSIVIFIGTEEYKNRGRYVIFM
jgi:hypothetical protein